MAFFLKDGFFRVFRHTTPRERREKSFLVSCPGLTLSPPRSSNDGLFRQVEGASLSLHLFERSVWNDGGVYASNQSSLSG